MDYPTSETDVNLYDDKFTDGDSELGIPASRDPASWANAVTDEFRNFFIAMGSTPSETDVEQLLKSMMTAMGYYVCTDGGAANDYDLTPDVFDEPTAYAEGLTVVWKAANAPTGASVIAVGGLDDVDLATEDGDALAGDEFGSGDWVAARYNATSGLFELTELYQAKKVERPPVLFCTDSGDGSVYTLAPVDGLAPSTFVNGMVVVFRAATTNALNPDIQLGTEISAKAFTKPGGAIMYAGTVKSGEYCIAVGTSGHFELMTLKKIGTFVNDSTGYPLASTTVFDVCSNIDQPLSGWNPESIGPTGSGADHEWAALDDVSKNDNWIKIRGFVRCYTTSGTSGELLTLFINARKGGAVTAQWECTIAMDERYVDSNGNAKSSFIFEQTVPINSSGVFELAWDSDFDTNSINIYLVGSSPNR